MRLDEHFTEAALDTTVWLIVSQVLGS